MINVLLIKEGIVAENYLYTGGQGRDSREAEHQFIELAEQHIPGWGELSTKDVFDILDDGYVTFGDIAICISHPKVGEL